jgi:hypothetical protein
MHKITSQNYSDLPSFFKPVVNLNMTCHIYYDNDTILVIKWVGN